MSEDDQCPICFVEWPSFVEPSVAAILPCAHACCVTCLIGLHRECFSAAVDGEEEEDRTEFNCVLCRKAISQSIIQKLAEEIVDARIVPSLKQLAKHLPFSNSEFKRLVVSLLTEKYEFDICKVEYALFNMVGLVDKQDTSQQIDHEKKQDFYKQARLPVVKLQEEFEKERQSLLNEFDNNSSDWKAKNLKLEELKKQLNLARANAARDIYERMNSKGNMGALLANDDDETNGTVHIDIHGLHLSEAKATFDEFVLPILPALKRVFVITGHGSHSQTGHSVLKEAMKEHFTSLNLRSKELAKNKGALFVYGLTSC